MAKRKGTTKNGEAPDAPTLVLPGNDEPEPPASEAVLVEDPADERPGTETPADEVSGDGKPVRDLEAENTNLKRALQADRMRRRRLMAELDAERRAREDADRRNADLAAAKDADAKLTKLEDVGDLREAVPIIREHLEETVIRPNMAKIRVQQLRLSQKMARREHTDYDVVLKDSGIEDAIAVDASGRPRDPVLWRKIILDSEDPAEDAYQIGLAELERQGKRRPAEQESDEEVDVLDESVGDRAAGRREVIEHLEQIGRRPVGIRTLPGQRGRDSKPTLSRKVIDAMSDQDYQRLPQHVREAYLMGAP